MDGENFYIYKRLLLGKLESILFYLCRIFPIHRRKIVFCCIEGTTGYSCNPKYIAEKLIKNNKNCELVWLVNDTGKKFPKEIKVVKNTLWNRAYQLTTARIWVDNSRKQLEARKRRGQIYIQTWHAKLGFKPTCLDRGASFTRIAYLVSKHDSDMVDYWLSNSDWYDATLKTGSLYKGKTLRFGSPRCDILVNNRVERRKKIRKLYGLPKDSKILMYAPTFRGGSQGTDRRIQTGEGSLDYDSLLKSLEDKFGGKWYIMLRLHPQLVVRNVKREIDDERIIDISRIDDMYKMLAGCDAFVTDYSSAAFDAAVMKIPIFLYCDDYSEYQKERGSLLWDLNKLPFGFAQNCRELEHVIYNFNDTEYQIKLQKLFDDTGMLEDGKASERMVDFIYEKLGDRKKISV